MQSSDKINITALFGFRLFNCYSAFNKANVFFFIHANEHWLHFQIHPLGRVSKNVMFDEKRLPYDVKRIFASVSQ